MPQQSGNAKTFAEAYLYFAGKKNAEAIEFLGLLKKNTFPRIKKIGLKERNILLNKKIIVLFFTRFSNLTT